MLVTELFAHGLSPRYACLAWRELSECLPEFDEEALAEVGEACCRKLLEDSGWACTLSRKEKAFVLAACRIPEEIYGADRQEVEFASSQDFFRALHYIREDTGLKALDPFIQGLAIDLCALDISKG